MAEMKGVDAVNKASQKRILASLPPLRRRRPPKTWTGEAIGKQILVEYAENYRRYLEGDPLLDLNIKTFLAHECLQNDEDRKDLLNFFSMKGWLTMNREQCAGQLQQCHARFKDLFNLVQFSIYAEDVLRYVEKTRHAVAADDEDLASVEEGFIMREPCILRDDIEGDQLDIFREKARASYHYFGYGYYFVSGFNHALERIAYIYKIPEILVFRQDIYILNHEIELVNEAIDILEDRLNQADYPRPDLLEMKKKNRRFFLPHIKAEDIVAPREQYKREIDRLIKACSCFGRHDGLLDPIGNRFLQILQTRPELYYPTSDSEETHG